MNDQEAPVFKMSRSLRTPLIWVIAVSQDPVELFEVTAQSADVARSKAIMRYMAKYNIKEYVGQLTTPITLGPYMRVELT
jgi:hypothetical protein